MKKEIALALAVGIAIGLSGCAGVVEAINGGVTMDATIVEQNIVDKYAEDSIAVTVECPDPFVAKVGESRNCLVTADDGSTAMAKVTVENSQGAFTWVAE